MLVGAPGDLRVFAAHFVDASGGERAAMHQRVVDALGKAERRRHGLWALGFAGRQAGAAACIELLAQGLETRPAW